MKGRPAMHENSLASFDEGKPHDFTKRQLEIIRLFRIFGKMTDRETLAASEYTDMNAVRPRITELIDRAIVCEVSSIICPVTKKRVRVCEIAPPKSSEFLPGFGGVQ